MSSFFKVIIFCVILLSSTKIFLVNTKAQDFITTTHNVEIKINEDSSATFIIDLNLKNNDILELIGGYNYIIPVQNIELSSVTLDAQPLSYNSTNIAGGIFSNLDISFADKPIKPGEQKNLKIQFNSKDFLKKKNSISFFKLEKSKDLIDSLVISYPSILGDPSLIVSSNNTLQVGDNNYKKILINNPKSIIAIWGDNYSYDFKTNFTITNTSERATQGIIGLISDQPNQEVAYKTVANSEFGVVDNFQNYYSYMKIEPKSQKVAGFEVKFRKKLGNINLNNLEYNLGFPENNNLLESIIDYVNRYEDVESKIRAVNDYLLINYQPDNDEKLDYKNIDDQWESLERKEKLESFDYCYIITAYAEYLNLEAQINFGYVLIPGEISILAPHFWCYVDFGEKTILIDPYLEAMTNYDYYGLKNDFDRVTFGIWHPSQRHNDALGLLSKAKPSQKIELIDIKELKTTDNLIDFSMEVDSGTVYSGFPHTYDFKFTNNSSQFIPLKSLYFDNKNYSNKLNLLQDLKIALLPGQVNNISLSSLRTNNIFESRQRNIEIEFELESEISQSISKEVPIKLEIYKDVLMTSAVILLLIMLMTIVIIKRFYKYKTRNRWKRQN
jgi:hypothetical protein